MIRSAAGTDALKHDILVYRYTVWHHHRDFPVFFGFFVSLLPLDIKVKCCCCCSTYLSHNKVCLYICLYKLSSLHFNTTTQ
jgi:hypothetical protein